MCDGHAFESFYQDIIYIYQEILWQNNKHGYLLYLFQTDIFYIYVYVRHKTIFSNSSEEKKPRRKHK